MRSSPLLLLLLVAFLPCSRLHGADAKARRNVVLLIADDMGLTLGCYGDKAAKTPHLDALSKSRRAVQSRFRRSVVVQSEPVHSLHGPAHAHQWEYGLAHAGHNFNSRPGVKSLPGLLRPAGYRTGIIGKVHVQPKSVYDFDFEPARVNPRNGVVMAKAARAFIEETGDKPFCLVMGYTDPHRAAKGFANNAKYPGIPQTKYDPKSVTVPYHLPDTPDVRGDLADYYESVSRCDYNIGLLLEVLKATGRDKDTLVIFLSDNGIPFPGAKTTLYDAGIHLPLIIHRPGQIKHGVVNRAMASWVDVLPTILDWAGAKIPANLAGRSILPILEQESPEGWDMVYASHSFHEVTMYYPMRVVRTRTHKYIRNLAHPLDYPFASDLYNSASWQGMLKRGDKMLGTRTVEQYVHRPLEELYDLEKDPNELKNLAADPAQAKTLAELRKKLRAWQEKTDDPWIVKYKYE